MAAHSNILAWRIPWTEEPGGLQSTGSQRVGHDWATSLSLSYLLKLWKWLQLKKKRKKKSLHRVIKFKIARWDPPGLWRWTLNAQTGVLITERRGEDSDTEERTMRTRQQRLEWCYPKVRHPQGHKEQEEARKSFPYISGGSRALQT